MSNEAHFFDLDTMVHLPQKAWIVNKKNPNLPLLKITQSEFKLIKSGIFSNKGNKIEFNGVVYYLPDELWNKLKVISSKYRINFSDFIISLQEFLNKDLIDEMDYELNLNPILNLQNSTDDIFLICSKQTKVVYEKLVNDIVSKLKAKGIIIKNYYYLNENFLNQNTDEIFFRKIKLLLQHSIGYKSDNNKFKDLQISKYERVNLYDKSLPLIDLNSSINYIFKNMLVNSESSLRDIIKDDLRDSEPIIYCYRIEDNLVNPYKIEKIKLLSEYLIKKFETFNILRFFP